MRRIVPVVDLFSGPGGLAEGFAAFRSPKRRRRFRIALSVEKNRDAHRTLRLRAFLRAFGRCFPPEYYDFLNGVVTEEPDWATLYPKPWAAACDETRCMELGKRSASVFLRQRIAAIREEHGGRTVLLGGPPCQSYSVIGRSRNVGNDNYDPDEDDRQSLYEQYVQVLDQLRPAVAVMENVKGMLSAQKDGKLIFPEVMRHLRRAGGRNGYQAVRIEFSQENMFVGRRTGCRTISSCMRKTTACLSPAIASLSSVSAATWRRRFRIRTVCRASNPMTPRSFSQGRHRRDAEGFAVA